MAARVLLCTAGSYGDLFPTVGLALGLKRRGYEPIVATSPRYRDLVENEHLRFNPIRPDINPFDPAILARAMDRRKGSEVVVRELAMPALRDSYEDFAALVPDVDLIISHPITFAAPVAAERYGVPWLSTVLAPASFFSREDFPVMPAALGLTHVAQRSPWVAGLVRSLARAASRSWVAPVAALRRELRLPERGHALFEGQFSPLGTLALFSSVMARHRADWPTRTTLTGFVFYDRLGQVPPDVRRFIDAGEAPVVFTLGSSAVGAPGSNTFFAESVEAAQRLGRRAILLVGHAGPSRLQSVPPGVLVADYLPHHALFPEAVAVVHHGGIGTLAQALRAGRPSLVVPYAHDQPDNAHRAARIGTARVLSADDYSGRRAAHDLARLISDPGYGQAAAEAGQRVAAEDGVTRACDAIEVALRTSTHSKR